MSFKRALPWVGWAGVGLMIVFALGFFYLSGQRLQLDAENRRELSHVAHDLRNILNATSDSAAQFFSESHLIQEFANRNPYVRSEGVPTETLKFPPKNDFCPVILNGPGKLELREKATQKPEFLLQLDVQKIFDDVPISEAFEYLFIADGGPRIDKVTAGKPIDGNIVFAMSHGEASRHEGGMGWLDNQAREHGDRDQAVIDLKRLGGIPDRDGKPIAASEFARSSGMYTVRIGDNGYQLFTYPFVTTAAPANNPTCGEAEHIWIVGGLVEPSRMWREAATLSPRSTLVLILALVLVLFLKPFLKLYFLRPTERLRFADACMLVPSATLLLMAATILLLEQGAHSRLNSEAAKGLQTLSSTVEFKLTDEFKDMRKQLVVYDGQLVTELGRTGCAMPPENIHDLLLKPSPYDFLSAPSYYKNFSQVAWIDSSGMQIFKATTSPHSTPRISVEVRPYFREPSYSPQHLWSFPGDEDALAGTRFFVQSDRSLTTAELNTALSIPSRLKDLKDACPGQKNYAGAVAAISGPPLAVERPLLAAGYDFAVIASDGQVLYHSDRRRALKEDFFAEVDDPEDVHAAIQGGAPILLTTMYSGQPTELLVRPYKLQQGMSPVPWFIVAMRDRRWLDAVSTEALVHSMAWGSLTWLLSLAVAVCALWKGKKVLRFWWPSPSREPFYRRLALAYLVLLAVGLIFVATSDAAGGGLFWFSLIFPGLLAAVTLPYWMSKRTPESSPLPYRPTWYLAAVTALWAAAAIVPAAGIFRHSWHLELDKLNGFERERDQRRQDDWAAEDGEYYRKRNIRMADPAGLAGGRLAFVTQHQYKVRYEGGSMPEYSSPEKWLDRHLPFYNEPVEFVRHQTPMACGDDPKQCTAAGLDFDIVSLLGFALIAVLAARWLGFSTRSLFWAQLVGSSPKAASGPLQEEPRLVLLLVPSLHNKRMLKQWLDRPAAAAASASALGGSAAAAHGSDLVLVDFEEDCGQEQTRKDALQRLEACQANGGRALLLANSNPLLLFSEENPESPFADLAPEEKQRWRQVLESFDHVNASVGQNDPDAPDTYESLWSNCSRDEQLTLVQVAHEGLANHHNGAAVKRLLESGLLKLDPELKLMNENFEKFVGERVPPGQLRQWEQPEGGMGWRGVRWIFLGVLIIALIFVAATGETWLKSATALMTALAAGLEGLWKIVTAVQRFKGPAEAGA